VIRGVVGPDGLPRVFLAVGGQDWPAVIDTGFNGDVGLPQALVDANPAVHFTLGQLEALIVEPRRRRVLGDAASSTGGRAQVM
jgi:hypothetical protein